MARAARRPRLDRRCACARFGRDNSIFLDDIYLIRGVAGAILWKLAGEFLRSGRREFSNRELRLAPELHLPDVQDNLEVRLLLLQRRLAEQQVPIQLEKAGRGRMRLNVTRADRDGARRTSEVRC